MRQITRVTWRTGAVAALAAGLSSCNMVVLSPSGDIAAQQANLVIISTCLMLLIIVPVIGLTLLFAWRYRQSGNAKYDPEWNHSTRLEVIIWSAPLTIIIVLGAITWISTHTLDPYRPLERISTNQPIKAGVKPLNVEVVALDWKWLFIYPDLGIASVNEMAAPANVPINFKITSSSVMNSFYVPALAGQIYAMAGMQTPLHAVMNRTGDFQGFSANYSGAGFSQMRFKFLSRDQAGFDAWVAKVKADGGKLTREVYNYLEKPSVNNPVHHYADTDPELYNAILNMCTHPGDMCMSDMMAIDAGQVCSRPPHMAAAREETPPGPKS